MNVLKGSIIFTILHLIYETTLYFLKKKEDITFLDNVLPTISFLFLTHLLKKEILKGNNFWSTNAANFQLGFIMIAICEMEIKKNPIEY